MNINFELYKVFYYVALTGTLTKASEIMLISQPAITKHIQNLESSLNASLMIRNKRGIILTSYGKQVYEQIKNIIISAKNVDSITNSFMDNYSGSIRIGSGKSMTSTYLISILTKMKKDYPKIVINFEIKPTIELIKELKNGELDFIVAKFPEERDVNLKYQKLGFLKDILIVGTDYPELLNKKIKIESLQNYPWILPHGISESEKKFAKVLKENNMVLNASTMIGSLTLIAKLVRENNGIGLVTKEYINDLIDNKSIFEIDVIPKLKTSDYGIITMKNVILSPRAEKFIEYLINQKN